MPDEKTIIIFKHEILLQINNNLYQKNHFKRCIPKSTVDDCSFIRKNHAATR